MQIKAIFIIDLSTLAKLLKTRSSLDLLIRGNRSSFLKQIVYIYYFAQLTKLENKIRFPTMAYMVQTYGEDRGSRYLHKLAQIRKQYF